MHPYPKQHTASISSWLFWINPIIVPSMTVNICDISLHRRTAVFSLQLSVPSHLLCIIPRGKVH